MLVLLEVSWRVPLVFPFIVGFVILAWALASGFLAFSGGQRSGLHDIIPPGRPSESISEDDQQ